MALRRAARSCIDMKASSRSQAPWREGIRPLAAPLMTFAKGGVRTGLKTTVFQWLSCNLVEIRLLQAKVKYVIDQVKY